MLFELPSNPWTHAVTRFRQEKQKDPVGVCVDELARLRFSINLAAQFADSPNLDQNRQQELRARLLVLKRQYAEKIDEIMDLLRVHKSRETTASLRVESTKTDDGNLAY